MPNCRLTLRVLRHTNVAQTVARLEAELLRLGVDQPALVALVRETGERFQRELGGKTDARSAYANTVLSGADYTIRITTRPASLLDAVGDALLPWQASFS